MLFVEYLERFGGMGNSNDMKILLTRGLYQSYENLVYLAGSCNVGKSSLASILIGIKIPAEWKSTNGLNVYFGRNGINLQTLKMVPLGIHLLLYLHFRNISKKLRRNQKTKYHSNHLKVDVIDKKGISFTYL